MIITPIKTHKVVSRQKPLTVLLDEYIKNIPDGSIIAITSKIVSLCEGRVASSSVSKEKLIADEADLYINGSLGKYSYHFTIIKNTLVAAAGIDESNVKEGYLLWPKDPQRTANEIRNYLKEKHKLKNLGVIITDSISTPLRLGTTGTYIAHSGFSAVNDYVGSKDLFGRTFNVSRANVAGGLAASAVVAMGEGTEQTPLCILSDLPKQVIFNDQSPSASELATIKPAIHDDLFEPFLSSHSWMSKNSQQ